MNAEINKDLRHVVEAIRGDSYEVAEEAFSDFMSETPSSNDFFEKLHAEWSKSKHYVDYYRDWC